jgi:hypothetical protein
VKRSNIKRETPMNRAHLFEEYLETGKGNTRLLTSHWWGGWTSFVIRARLPFWAWGCAWINMMSFEPAVGREKQGPALDSTPVPILRANSPRPRRVPRYKLSTGPSARSFILFSPRANPLPFQSSVVARTFASSPLGSKGRLHSCPPAANRDPPSF